MPMSSTSDGASAPGAANFHLVAGVLPLRCPDCGSDMRILAFLTDPEPVSAILRCLDLPHTALELDTDPVAPVDPLPADDFDPTPAFDPVDPEPMCTSGWSSPRSFSLH